MTLVVALLFLILIISAVFFSLFYWFIYEPWSEDFERRRSDYLDRLRKYNERHPDDPMHSSLER